MRLSPTSPESSDRRLFQRTSISCERENVALLTNQVVELPDISQIKGCRREMNLSRLSSHYEHTDVWRESNHEHMFRMLENISEIRNSLLGPADRLPDLIVVYQLDHDWMIASDERLTDVGKRSRESNRRKILSPIVEEHLHLSDHNTHKRVGIYGCSIRLF